MRDISGVRSLGLELMVVAWRRGRVGSWRLFTIWEGSQTWGWVYLPRARRVEDLGVWVCELKLMGRDGEGS